MDAEPQVLADRGNRPAGPAGWDSGAMAIYLSDRAAGMAERAWRDARLSAHKQADLSARVSGGVSIAS